jgi:very-short-patch-repair endonuclease
VLTVDQLRGPLVKRVLHGVYRPAWVPLTHELLCRAASLVLPPEAQITGRSAAAFRGVTLNRPDDAVEVVVPFDTVVPTRTGVSVRHVSSGLDVGEQHGSVVLADPLRMAFDLAARTELPVAVARLDAVVRAGLVDQPALEQWLSVRRDKDVRHVRRAAAHIDPKAESLPESSTRVILREAGFAVVPQVVVRHGGEFVARVDLALEDLRIAIEYDGQWHELRGQLQRDRTRLNALNQAGWLVVHVTAEMLRDPARLVAAVEAAVRQRLRARY